MIREKVKVSTRTLQWKCVESRVDSKRLYYGRFILSPLRKGQAETIGIAMRRILLGEIEGTCITRAKSEKIPHEYSTIVGIQESIHEILMNLKEIVLRSNLYGTRDASICFKGPGYVTAQDIILPPSVEIVDNTQHIANLTEPIHLCIELQIERNRGYRIKTLNNIQDGSYTIDAVFMPVRNANHSIHSYVNGTEKLEILFLEIWTNGSLTPKEALYEASRNLIDLFIPFLHAEEENLEEENFYLENLEEENFYLENLEEENLDLENLEEENFYLENLDLENLEEENLEEENLEEENFYLENLDLENLEEENFYLENFNLESNQHKVTLPLFTEEDRLAKDKQRENKKAIALKSIFIDQLELPPRIYNCLKKSNIHTLFELLNKSQEDLMKMEHFRVEDIKHILNIKSIYSE
uniref:DNA-directed RNA polymerase subunit alpha n=1 Tax=Hedysarum polybotrys var. alaschanicum TaxID=2862780 RepID=A0A8F8XBZ6_9FABA|nr:RNA polymerase alpha subunit [Hedysarum polybotrys var. alaschanicum]